jgi:hypothetical protein
VPISLIETHVNRDSCGHKVFLFYFRGSATFNDVTSTQTLLASSHNPSAVGQSVTYSATVISGGGSGNQHGVGSPTGTITFYDGSTVICSSVPVTSGPNETAAASCTPPTYSTTGTHLITAMFTNTDGNFADSTSAILDQLVQSARKTVRF